MSRRQSKTVCENRWVVARRSKDNFTRQAALSPPELVLGGGGAHAVRPYMNSGYVETVWPSEDQTGQAKRSVKRNRASSSHHMGKFVPQTLLYRLTWMPPLISGG